MSGHASLYVIHRCKVILEAVIGPHSAMCLRHLLVLFVPCRLPYVIVDNNHGVLNVTSRFGAFICEECSF